MLRFVGHLQDGAGVPFVSGSSAGLAGIFAAGSNGLSPVALQGQSIPKPADYKTIPLLNQ